MTIKKYTSRDINFLEEDNALSLAKAKKGSHEAPHTRRSKTGKVFQAGKGTKKEKPKSKGLISAGGYDDVSASVQVFYNPETDDVIERKVFDDGSKTEHTRNYGDDISYPDEVAEALADLHEEHFGNKE